MVAKHPVQGLVIGTATVLLFAAGGASLVAQEKPSPPTGRYTMSPVDGGFARLDTETGAMSICKSKGADWACEPMSDLSAALKGQVAKLENDNQDLRTEIKRLEDLIGLGDKKDGTEGKRPERPGGGLTLPSEEDVDKALSYLERMVKKFQDKIKQFEGGHSDRNKGTPL